MRLAGRHLACGLFIAQLILLCCAGPHFPQTCKIDSPVGPLSGDCVLIERGESRPKCAGGWATGRGGCSSNRQMGEWQCCLKPTPCRVPGFGDGHCYDRKEWPCTFGGTWKQGYCFGKGANSECCALPTATKPSAPPPSPPPGGTKPSTANRPPQEFTPAPEQRPAFRGLYSLSPVTPSRFYILGAQGSVKFIAKGGDLEIGSVIFFLNGQKLGPATKCGKSDWCYDLWFGFVHAAQSTLTAVADVGPSVYYNIPVFQGGWLWDLLHTSPTNPTLSVPVTLSASHSSGGSYNIPAPVLGFEYKWLTTFAFSVVINPGGQIIARVSGTRQDEFVPAGPYLHTRWQLIVSGGLEVRTVESDQRRVYEPAFQSGTVSIQGKLYLPTPLTWGKRYSILGCPFGAKIEVAMLISSSVRVTFGPDDKGRFFGIPCAVKAVDGTLIAFGVAITGSVDFGFSVSIVGEGTIGPVVHWDAASGGMKFQGVTVSIFVTATGSIGPFSATITILQFTKQLKRQSDDPEATIADVLGEIKRGSASADQDIVFSAVSPIENIWEPRVTSSNAPFLVENLFPSSSLGSASARNKDVLVWLSFDPNKRFPEDLQVQYTWRAHGGNWSELLFVPSQNYSMVMPALEDIESTGQIMLVASQLLTPDAKTFNEMQLRLVYSLFDTNTHTWTAYQPVFDHMPVGADWVPVFSESGLWMAFIRAPHNGVGAGMYSTRFINGRWTEPQPIMSPMPKMLAFSLDASPRGDSAMIAYVTDSPNINLCFYELGHWSCGISLHAATESTALTVTYTSDAYLLLWAVNNTIHSIKLSTRGEQLNRFTLQTLQDVKGMVAGVCELAGPGTVLVGWNEHINTSLNTVFHYAVADPNGALHYAPSNVAPQLETDDSNTLQTTAMQLAWTGSHLLYATMVASKTSGEQRAQIAAYDLSFRGDVHLSNPRFSPDDFSTPLVNVTVTLTNLGLSTVPAGGQAIFVFVTPSETEYVVGQAPLTSPLLSQQFIDVSIVWNTAVNTSEGGVLRVSFVGFNGTLSDRVLQVDAASFGLSNATIARMPGGNQSAVAVFLSVAGPAVSEVELQAWTRLEDGGDSILLGSTKHLTTPNSREPVFIPLSNASAVFRILQVRVIASHQRAALHTTAYDERYDFAMLLSEIVIEPFPSDDGDSTSRYRIDLPIRNYGNTGAPVQVRARIRLEGSSGAEYHVLDTTRTFVGGHSVSNASLEVTVSERASMIHLQVNCDEQPLPELNRENNEVWISLLNEHAPEPAPLNFESSTPPEASTDSSARVDPSYDAPVAQLSSRGYSNGKSVATIVFIVALALTALMSTLLLAVAFVIVRKHYRNRAANTPVVSYQLQTDS